MNTEILFNEAIKPDLLLQYVTGSFYEAVYHSVKGLLYRQFYDVNTGELTEPCISTKTAIQALNKAIGYGGGHTLNPNIGNYWMVEYWPGIKLTLVKSKGEEIVNEKVNRSMVLQIAEKCLSEYKGENVQLSLF